MLLEDRFFLLVVGVQFDKKLFGAVWALGNQIRLMIGFQKKADFSFVYMMVAAFVFENRFLK